MFEHIVQYQNLPSLNTPPNSQEQLIIQNTAKLNLATLQSDALVSDLSSPFISSADIKSTETTKRELIQRILASSTSILNFESFSRV